MNIKALAQETGVSSTTIRYYENKGFLPEPLRLVNGYRSYSQDYVEKLNLIKLCQSLGFKLDEISSLMWGDEPKEHEKILAALIEKQSSIDSLISQLSTKKQKLSRLHSVLSKAWEQGDCLTANEISKLIEG